MEKETQNFYAFRGQWLDYLSTRRDLSHGEFRVAYFIASKINPAEERMWWGVKTISREMGVSLKTVSTATDKLKEEGLLIISKGLRGLNYYSLRMPLDPAGAAFASAPVKRKKTGGRKSRVSKNETG